MKILLFQHLLIFDMTIIIECANSHIHYFELEPIILKNPQITFILIHFSMRYKEIEIKNKPDNVILWLN